jgi:hypothetical protein
MWHVNLIEEHKLRVFQNRILWTISGPMSEENADKFCSSPVVIGVIILKGIGN